MAPTRRSARLRAKPEEPAAAAAAKVPPKPSTKKKAPVKGRKKAGAKSRPPPAEAAADPPQPAASEAAADPPQPAASSTPPGAAAAVKAAKRVVVSELVMKRAMTVGPVSKIRRTPASGRWWKAQVTGPSSAKMVKPHPKKGSAWARRKEVERAKRDLIELQRDLKEQKDRHMQEKRERSVAQRKMKLENERRGEVTVAITNTRKLKKMSRKQLRLLDKR